MPATSTPRPRPSGGTTRTLGHMGAPSTAWGRAGDANPVDDDRDRAERRSDRRCDRQAEHLAELDADRDALDCDWAEGDREGELEAEVGLGAEATARSACRQIIPASTVTSVASPSRERMKLSLPGSGRRCGDPARCRGSTSTAPSTRRPASRKPVALTPRPGTPNTRTGCAKVAPTATSSPDPGPSSRGAAPGARIQPGRLACRRG